MTLAPHYPPVQHFAAQHCQPLLSHSFGALSLPHSLNQEPIFKTAQIVILNAGLYSPSDILMLYETHPLLSHLLCMRPLTTRQHPMALREQLCMGKTKPSLAAHKLMPLLHACSITICMLSMSYISLATTTQRLTAT